MALTSPTFKPIINTGALNFSVIEENTVLGKCQILLPDGTRSFTLRSRSTCTLNISHSLSGPYITVNPKCCLTIDNVEFTGKILYIESSISVTTIETLITHG
jgi:hypothetical protein